MNAVTILAVALTTLAAAGCGPTGGTEGELGHGQFFYQCAGSGDAACAPEDLGVITFDFATADGQEVPRAIAVGAPFGMIYQGDALYTDSPTHLEPGASRLVSLSGEGFRVEAPSTVSFLAIDLEGQAVDFTDLLAEAVEAVGAEDEDGAPLTSISLHVGEVVRVSAAALGASGVPLAGSLSWGFTAGDAVTIWGDGASLPNTNRAFVSGVQPGATVLHLTVQGVSADVSVDVTD